MVLCDGRVVSFLSFFFFLSSSLADRQVAQNFGAKLLYLVSIEDLVDRIRVGGSPDIFGSSDRLPTLYPPTSHNPCSLLAEGAVIDHMMYRQPNRHITLTPVVPPPPQRHTALYFEGGDDPVAGFSGTCSVAY